ncbi:MAG: histidinol dehydrogenase [Clostridia bacterium]|nr:histidinol dehydrogenase [Clostridia bacterium]
MLKTLIYENNIDDIINKLNSRKEDINKDVTKAVEDILKDIKQNGDKAVIKYAEKFDGFKIEKMEDIKVTEEEINAGIKNVGENFIRILNRAKDQITEFHKNQKGNSWNLFKENGVIMGQMVRPLERVCVYVPGGTASYPSTVLMNVIPARLAGVKEIIMITPVKENGKVPDSIIAAAEIAGVDIIYKIGGVQGIGAVAYGTETIKKVDKIVGPGNIYVATAKKQVYGLVDIDMIAGPSEVLVIADENSNPKYIAADLMSQAEHDKLSSSILITTDKTLSDKVNKEIERQIKGLSRKDIIEYSMKNFGASIIVENLDEAFAISNEIAPEHIEVLTEEPISKLPKIKNAGSIFLGENSPEPLGDYMSGTNHVLPTSGTAKFYSGLGVYDFVKYSSYSYYPRDILETFKDDVIEFANIEGLDAHANSIKVRFEE